MDGRLTRVSLMSKGMFCLVRTSPGFGASFGEYAWFKVNTSAKVTCRNDAYNEKTKPLLYLAEMMPIMLPGTGHHSKHKQFLGASSASSEVAVQKLQYSQPVQTRRKDNWQGK